MQTGNSGQTILVADDDLEVCNYFETLLKIRGYSVLLADSGEEALRFLAEGQPTVSLAILDVMMPRKDGIETLKEIRRLYGELPVILVSSAFSWPFIMDALDGDSAGFLEKPVMSAELFREIEERLGEERTKSAPPEEPASSPGAFNGPPCPRNTRMMEIEGLIRQVGFSDVPVLLQGETGVGKEVLARQLHCHSLRAKNQFLKLNCAALPPELVESELFGYERGAFTGAFKDRPGKFEMARGGTILLDEIGDMDFRLQAKLLHVLQDSEFQRLGSSDTVHVDVRIMAATHRDLRKAIREGGFREDLYYRLNVINIYVPPIRERKDEILWLADYFLKKHATPNMPSPPMTSAMQHAMLAYEWPGNVRELENMMRRFLVLRQPNTFIDELSSLTSAQHAVDSHPTTVAADTGAPILQRLQQSKQRGETEAILAALNATHWHRKNAAKMLSMGYQALLHKMRKLGITGRPIAD